MTRSAILTLAHGDRLKGEVTDEHPAHLGRIVFTTPELVLTPSDAPRAELGILVDPSGAGTDLAQRTIDAARRDGWTVSATIPRVG